MSTIPADDPLVSYSPYTWLVGAGQAKTINAGAYLRLAFAGTPTTLAATFDVTGMAAIPSRVGVRVDGGAWQDVDVAASVPIALPTDNTWGEHLVELVVVATTETAARWSTQSTAVVFTGLTADTTISPRPVRARTLYGLVFGDSITEGVRTLAMNATRDVDRNDTRLAYAYPLGDLLGAELGVVGFGATGISKAGSGGVPEFADSLPYLWAGQERDLTSPRPPDFVIGNVGTNDGASTDADVTADTTRLVDYLAGATPSTTPILILPGWKQIKAAAIQAGIAASAAAERVTFVDTTGWWDPSDASDSVHPYGYINLADLAPRLAGVLRDVFTPTPFALAWIRTDSGKVALPAALVNG